MDAVETSLRCRVPLSFPLVRSDHKSVKFLLNDSRSCWERPGLRGPVIMKFLEWTGKDISRLPVDDNSPALRCHIIPMIFFGSLSTVAVDIEGKCLVLLSPQEISSDVLLNDFLRDTEIGCEF